MASKSFVLVAIGVLAAAACSSSSNSNVPRETTTPGSTSAIDVRDLLTPLPNTFQVVFKWTAEGENGEGLFVLRHRGSRERWDWLFAGSRDAGSIDIADDKTVISCLWLTTDLVGQMDSSCGASHSAQKGSNALRLALDARVRGVLRDRRIAEHDANCYAFSNVDGSQGELCVDAGTHVLLYLSGRSGLSSNALQVLEAQSVSSAPSEMGDATSDSGLIPLGNDGQSTSLPLATLDLPPEFHVGQ